MSQLTVVVGANTSGLSTGLARAKRLVKNWSAHAQNAMKKPFQIAAGMLVYKSITGVLQGITGAIKTMVMEAGQMEQMILSFEILTGSAKASLAMISRLEDFAATTPFQLQEVGSAARQLLAYGSAASQIPKELRAIGDVASGVGAPLKDIAYLFGTSRTQGRLFARDINQLTNRGIPIIQALGKTMGVTTTKVKELVTEGSVGFKDFEAAFMSLSAKGGSFFDMTERNSKTFLGLWSTLKDNILKVLRTLGKPVIDWLKPMLEAWIVDLKRFAAVLAEAFRQDVAFELLGLGFDAVAEAFKNKLLDALAAAGRFIMSLPKKLNAAFSGSDMKNAFEAHLFETSVPGPLKQKILDAYSAGKIDVPFLDAKANPGGRSYDAEKAWKDRLAELAADADAYAASQPSFVEATAGHKGIESGMDAADKIMGEVRGMGAEETLKRAEGEEKIRLLKERQADLTDIINDKANRGTVKEAEALRDRLAYAWDIYDIEKEMWDLRQKEAQAARDKKVKDDAQMKEDAQKAFERRRNTVDSALDSAISGAPVNRLARIGGGGLTAPGRGVERLISLQQKLNETASTIAANTASANSPKLKP